MAKGKILVVDDDPDFVAYTRTVLESDCYEVVSAGNSDQGLRVLAQEKPDLVILDVIMSSVLDGLSMSQRMAEDVMYRHVPILMSPRSPTTITWRFSRQTRASILTLSSPSRSRHGNCSDRWENCCRHPLQVKRTSLQTVNPVACGAQKICRAGIQSAHAQRAGGGCNAPENQGRRGNEERLPGKHQRPGSQGSARDRGSHPGCSRPAKDKRPVCRAGHRPSSAGPDGAVRGSRRPVGEPGRD